MEKGHGAFVAFVDVLSSALADEREHTAGIAARVGLSRSHFSRLVTAASGEPPAALRRRILLERSAYLLITTDATILDVAVGSGYSSHEAFTRAFAAAYGLTPRRWRLSPTRFQIDAPNRVHFHPPDSLLLPARRKVSGMDLVVQMLEHNVWLTDEMLQRCHGLSDQVLDRPIELSVVGVDADPTLRSLLARLVGQLEMWNAAFAGQPHTRPDDTPAILELRRRLSVVAPEFITRVRAITEEGRLDEAVVCPGDQVEVYTYGAVIAHILTYAAHRRILAASALNDAGHTDLDEDPVRWISATA
jgi:AraC family transcriptional regulator